MGGLTTMLAYLLMAGGAASAVLVVLVIYGNALDTRADEEIYLNKTEEKMMASEQPALINRMNRLARTIKVVAVTAGVFLLASAGVWVYIGLHKSKVAYPMFSREASSPELLALQKVEFLDSGRPEEGSTWMFWNCANMACSAPFEYRRGRILRFHQTHPKGKEPKNSHAVRHFWLCAKCSETYSLEYQEGRVEVVPRRLIVFSG